MNISEKIRVDRVICDEIFYLEFDQFNVPIGEIRVPENAEISGTVTVNVLSCEPIVDFENNRLLANVVLLIQKELFVSFFPDEEPPGGTAAIFPLEFTERVQRQVEFRKCTPNELENINSELLDNLRCHVDTVVAEDRIELNPSTVLNSNRGTNEQPTLLKDATFSQELTIRLKLKLVQELQIVVALPDENTQTQVQVLEIPLPPVAPNTNKQNR